MSKKARNPVASRIQKTRPALILFLFGALLSPLGDWCHVHSHTTEYVSGALQIPALNLPWWEPIEFGLAVVLIALPELFRKRSRPAPGRLRTFACILCSMALFCASGFIPLQTGGMRDLVLGAGALAIWKVFDGSTRTFVYSVVAAICASSMEILLSHFGIFNYIAPNFFGIASWIPWVYFAAVPAIFLLAQSSAETI